MADTKYEIDVTVPTGGLSAGAAAVDSLASGLVSAGASSAQLSAALASVQARLATAAAFVTSANAAVAAGASSYAAAETAADRAAKAVERIGQQVAAQEGKLAKALEVGDTSGAARAEAALGRLAAKQQEAQSAAASAASAVEVEAAALDSLKAAASAAEAEHEALASSAKQVEGEVGKAAAAEKKAADAAAGSGQIEGMGEAFGKLGGPAGMAGQKLFGFADAAKKMAGSMGGGAAAIVGLTVVVIALTAALAAGVIALFQYGVGLANTKRDAALSTEALSRTSDSLKNIGTIMPQVAASTGVTGEALADLAKQLSDAKVSAADMPAALKAAAMAESALGKGGASKLIEDLKAGKKTASELAKEMESKFGDIVRKKMLSLDSSALKLKGSLAETFGGLNIEALLAGLSKAAGWLSQNHALGRALKFVFEGLFQPLVDAAAASIPKVERFLLGVAIGALRVYNALRPAIAAVGELFGADTSGLPDALEVGKVVGGALAGVLSVVASVIVGIIATVQGMVSGFQAAWAIGSAAFNGIAGAISAALAIISSIDMGSVGSALIDGLVAGIMGGISSVIAAASAVGTAAVNAAKSVLGIASPSKVFAEMGGYTAEGFSQGVDAGAEDAQGAMRDMVAPPSAGAPGAAGADGKAAGGGGSPVFNFYGVKDAEQGVGMFVEAWRSFMEGGLTPAPTT